MRCFDLFSCTQAIEQQRLLGWDGVCVAGEYSSNFRKSAEDARKTYGSILVAALIADDAAKSARKALDAGADLVIVDGRREDAAREASESWEVDLIVNPELNEEHDLVKQMSSGLDHVMAAYMAERGIGYLVNAGNILHCSGQRRSRLFARIMQNLILSKKYGLKVVLSCGARNMWDVRSPDDMVVVGRLLGFNESQARDAVARNPEHFVKKAADRASPDVLMKGLTVNAWGSQERRLKRKYGWY